MGGWGAPVVFGKRQYDADAAAAGGLVAGGGLAARRVGTMIQEGAKARAAAADQRLARQKRRHGQIARVGRQAQSNATSAHQASLKAIKDKDPIAASNLKAEAEDYAVRFSQAAERHRSAQKYVDNAARAAERTAAQVPHAIERGALVRRVGGRVAAGGAAVALGAGALHEARRRKERPGWQPKVKDKTPLKNPDMDELARRARRARVIGMGAHGSAADDEIAPGVAARVTSYGKAVGSWKTIDQRQDSQYRARRWKRRGLGAAATGATVAVGQELASPGSARSARSAVGLYRRASRQVDDARALFGRKDMDPRLTKPRIAAGIARQAPLSSKIVAGGAAAAAGGAATALGARAVESYQQRRINERRKANAARRKT